ncbi:unnamed protein product, partial [Discosporangium mesarthrocarpum]
YQQIAGNPAFDADGSRNDNSAVFVITEGVYFFMVAESNGVATLFDAPEGKGKQVFNEAFPTSSWIPESIKAIIGADTKLKYIVYSHVHW